MQALTVAFEKAEEDRMHRLVVDLVLHLHFVKEVPDNFIGLVEDQQENC